MIEIFVKNLLKASLVGSIGIISIMILQKTLLKKYTRAFTYYIWLAVIIKMLIPFKIPIYMSEKICNIVGYSPSNIKTIINNGISINQGIKIENSINIVSDNNNLNYFIIVFHLWLIVSIIFLSYHIISYFVFNNKIKHLVYDVPDNNIKNIYLKLLKEMNIKKKISLKSCKAISTPLGIGIFNARIVIPTVSYDIQELKYILKHELMHYKRHDIMYKIVLLITLSIHWFNPLVYIMCKVINNDCELSCDEAVLKRSDIKERKLYASALVNSLRLNKNNIVKQNLITGFNNKKNILKRRLENMLNLETRKKGILIGALATIITVSLSVSLNTLAKSNTDELHTDELHTEKFYAGETIQGITIVSVDKEGRPTKIKYKTDSVLNEEKIMEIIGKSDKDSIRVKPYSTKPVQFNVYTYENAPSDVKAQYEADVKAVNGKVSPSDEILVPTE
ncbi:M56 family metallopeptidase [Clostridium sp. BJN0013]|uniref:M56 family metallopeptidase n=1 Tax=Clostridium sp. BJN0013 TaxID=3236840 RepID=UPI0034C69EC1